MARLREATQNTTDRLRSEGYEVIEIWEHDFRRMKAEMPDLRDFLKTHTMEDRLNPRDSFFGGRTNAIQLFYQGVAKYVDFTSLYPWVSIEACFSFFNKCFEHEYNNNFSSTGQ